MSDHEKIRAEAKAVALKELAAQQPEVLTLILALLPLIQKVQAAREGGLTLAEVTTLVSEGLTALSGQGVVLPDGWDDLIDAVLDLIPLIARVARPDE